MTGSCIRGLSNVDDTAQRSNIRENEVRARNGSVKINLTAIDPGDRQSQRLAADEIGKLRLSGVQDFILGAT